MLFTCNVKPNFIMQQEPEQKAEQIPDSCIDCQEPADKLYYQGVGPLCIHCYDIVFNTHYSNHF